MNNNDLNANQSINTNLDNNIPNQPTSADLGNNTVIQPQQPIGQPVPNIDQTNLGIQQQMQTIPTVDQNQQDFLNNSQVEVTEKKENNKNNINITFVVIMFIIIFAAIYFLFPYLLNFTM